MDFDLVEQLKVSLFENSIDVATDFAEIGLDNLLSDITDSEILQEIPIIKTIYSVCKVGLAIQEKHLLKKTLVFIKEFNSKQIKSKKLEKYKKKINEQPHYVEEELGRVLILLNKILDDSKAVILAKLYRTRCRHLILSGPIFDNRCVDNRRTMMQTKRKIMTLGKKIFGD